MELAMESNQKGIRRISRMAFRNVHGQQTRQRNSTDPSRAMVVTNQHVNQIKSSTSVRQAVLDLLGTLIDEKA
jgi:hypothetical protein